MITAPALKFASGKADGVGCLVKERFVSKFEIGDWSLQASRLI